MEGSGLLCVQAMDLLMDIVISFSSCVVHVAGVALVDGAGRLLSSSFPGWYQGKLTALGQFRPYLPLCCSTGCSIQNFEANLHCVLSNKTLQRMKVREVWERDSKREVWERDSERNSKPEPPSPWSDGESFGPTQMVNGTWELQLWSIRAQVGGQDGCIPSEYHLKD